MLSRTNLQKLYQIVCTILLALVLIGLPITSFPWLIQFTGSLVAPFSAVPLLGLILIWLVPFLIRQGTLPKEFSTIFYFLLVVIITSAGAYFFDGFFSRNRTFINQSLRALFTLGIGLSFYITLSAYLQDQSTIKQAILFIYAGGIVLILWSIVEIVVLKSSGSVQNFPDWVIAIKKATVFQQPGMMYTSRLTGFAYEPSWFVLIFNLVLFPLWLSSVFQRKSLFSIKIWAFIIEDFFLMVGLIVFMFSYPRIGLLSLVLMFLYLGVLIIKRLSDKLNNWIVKKRGVDQESHRFLRSMIIVTLLILSLLVIFGATTAFIKIASQRDFRFQLIINQFISDEEFKLPSSETEVIVLARSLAFLERTVYWFGGWNIFKDYPFGVGLGNAGFYMVDRMNSLGYSSFEVRNILYQSDSLMNVKALWIRLLAETGFVGFSVYLTWLYLLWRNSSLVQKSRIPVLQIVGLAGKFFILAYLVEGFSIDSFSFPYPWVTAGLISASSLIVRKEFKNNYQELNA